MRGVPRLAPSHVADKGSELYRDASGLAEHGAARGAARGPTKGAARGAAKQPASWAASWAAKGVDRNDVRGASRGDTRGDAERGDRGGASGGASSLKRNPCESKLWFDGPGDVTARHVGPTFCARHMFWEVGSPG